MSKWISVKDRLPEYGQFIDGKNINGDTWAEAWGEEPLGNMTHWKPSPPKEQDNG